MNNNKENSNNEALVNKLHGHIEVLRKERDRAHRSKEVSLQRSRMAKEEEQSLSNIVNEMQQKFDSLLKSATKIKGEIGPMEQDVQNKTNEVSLFCVR